MKDQSLLLLFFLCGFLLFTTGHSATAQKISTLAQHAFLIDMTTNTVLFEKNADERIGTSSMSKIFTLYMLFEALKSGRFSLDDEILVSEQATLIKGSTMFLEPGQYVRVEDLIRGIIVLSGNDASRVVAEALSGSEQTFAETLNNKAREFGLRNSHFTNATGWPDPQHYSTVRDLATISIRMIADFPEYYHYYLETEFEYNGVLQRNRMRELLGGVYGVDGLKTGQTEKEGYSLALSASQNNRRLVLVINGLLTHTVRIEQARHLLAWGMRTFDMYTLFEVGETIDYIPVWLGIFENVPVTVLEPLRVTLTKAQRQDMQVSLKFLSPIPAPIKRDDVVGDIFVTAPDGFFRQLPLTAAISIERLGFFGRVFTLSSYFLFGWMVYL